MMKAIWFKRCGWFFVPVSVAGYILLVLAVAFCVQVFIAIDRRSHSASDTLYGIFPYYICTFLLLDWIARRTCGSAEARS